MLKFKNNKGIVSIIMAVAMPVLVGFLALGIDLSIMRLKNTQYQNVADSLAINLGHDVEKSCNGKCTLTYLQDEALVDGARNGCDPESIYKCNINVLWPYEDNELKVKVVIDYNNLSFFPKVWNSKLSAFEVNAVVYQSANAPTITNHEESGSGCILTLSTYGTNVNFQNGQPSALAGVVNPDCEVISNSSDSNSIVVENNGGIAGTASTVNWIWNI